MTHESGSNPGGSGILNMNRYSRFSGVAGITAPARAAAHARKGRGALVMREDGKPRSMPEHKAWYLLLSAGLIARSRDANLQMEARRAIESLEKYLQKSES
jgi:hypothetical protein